MWYPKRKGGEIVDREYKVLTLPRSTDQPVCAVLGVMLLIFGTLLTGAAIREIGSLRWSGWIFLVPSLAACAWGGQMIWSARLRIRVFPEGIAVMDGVRGIFQIPAEEIRTICFMEVFNGKQDIQLIGISPLSMETLADRREQELLKNPLSKYNVPIRKRNPEWQELFAREYLEKITKAFPFVNLQKGILWISYCPERLDLLRQTYPQAQVIRLKRQHISDKQKIREFDPTYFPRGDGQEDVRMVVLWLEAVTAGSCLWICSINGELWPVALLAFVCFSLLWGGICLAFGGESDRIRLDRKEIALLRNGKTLRRVAAEQVKAMYCLPVCFFGSLPMDMILVADQLPQEWIREEERALEGTADGRNLLEMVRQLPDPEKYILSCAVKRRTRGVLTLFSKELCFAGTPARKAVLREYCPDAQWIEIS